MSVCSCGVEIKFVKKPGGGFLVVEAEPNPLGSVIVDAMGYAGPPLGCEMIAAQGEIYLKHYPICPHGEPPAKQKKDKRCKAPRIYARKKKPQKPDLFSAS